VLIGEQPHQIRRHLHLSGRHPIHRHNEVFSTKVNPAFLA
jgi:hypothetical protein